MPTFPPRHWAGLLVFCAGAAYAGTPLLGNPSELAHAALGPLPGTAIVGVLQADRPSYGAAGTQAKQSEQLLFEIGSVTKMFSGLLLAQAVERNELKLDTTLGSLKLTKAPLPPKVAAITLGQLVTHTSCLPSDPNDIGGDTDVKTTLAHYPRARLWTALANQQMNNNAPCAWEYSNFGFAVLAQALAVHYRTSWEQLVHQRITGPLGMRDTIVRVGRKADRLAVGYSDGKPVTPWNEWGALVGMGGLHTTARDMLTFSRALLAGRSRPLGAAAERMLQPLEGSQHGYAFDQIRGPAQRRTYSKNGRTGGYSSYWALLPDSKEALIVLASNADANVDRLGLQLLVQRYPAPEPVTGSGGNLLDYTGVYRINENRTVTFVVQDGQLYGRLTGQRFNRLLPAGNDTYVLPQANAAFSFGREHGQVKTVSLRQLGDEIFARRTDQAPPSAARLSTVTQQIYGGHYVAVIPEGTIGYIVQARDGQLEILPDKENKQLVFPQEGQADQFVSEITLAKYRFERDASGAVSALTAQQGGSSLRALRVIPAAPPIHDVAVYLRGSMNDWGTQTRLEPADDGKLSALVTLPKGTYKFKVASEDWKAVDLGSIGSDANTSDGTPHAIGPAGEDLMLTVAEPSNYRVTLDSNGSGTLQLSVSKVQ